MFIACREDRMTVRMFALILGIIYLLVGIAGFIPGLVTPPPAHAPGVAIHANHGYLLGLFPINLLHNLVHLAIGIWGIYAYSGFDQARTFSRGLAVIFGILAIMGLFPVLNVTFGLIPIHGHDIWLHALTALMGAYFGYLVPAEATDRYRTARDTGPYDRGI